MANDASQVPELVGGLHDTSNNPLVGAQVFFYEVGTTTKKTLWVDANEVTPSTNPVVLDGNGAAVVFANGLYDIVVATATSADPPDDIIETWDDFEYQKGWRNTAETIGGVKTFTDGIKTDTISEITPANGVDIDGVKLKDNKVYADYYEEKTSGAGIIFETSAGEAGAIKMKDNILYCDNFAEKTASAGITFNHAATFDSTIGVTGILTASAGIKTDTIDEETADAGVTIEGVLIKDGVITSSNAIAQGSLKSTTGEVAVLGVATTNITLPGGEYGFFPQFKIQTGATGGWGKSGSSVSQLVAVTGSTSYVTTIKIDSITASKNFYTQQRYIQASPPYDLGNGEIPLFIYAVINNSTSEIESTYIAEDPPWAYNGKYRLNPQMMFSYKGNKYIKRNKIPFTREEALLDKEKLLANMAAIRNPKVEAVLVTQERKNMGMVDVPHPFQGNDLTGKSIVLLDPCSNLCEDLHLLSKTYDEGVSEVTQIINKGLLAIGNSHKKGLITPNGVIGVSVRWK